MKVKVRRETSWGDQRWRSLEWLGLELIWTCTRSLLSGKGRRHGRLDEEELRSAMSSPAREGE